MMENNQEKLVSQPVPSELPLSQKPVLLKWLLIVFLFSLAVFGGVLYVQNTNKPQIATIVPTQIPQITPSLTPDVTANWETYLGKTYQFKYPSGFVAGTSTLPSSPEYPKGGSYVYFNGDKMGISITEADNTQNLTLDNALGKGPYQSFSKEIITDKNISEITIDGVKAKVVKNVPTGLSGNIAADVIWIKGKTIYEASAADEKNFELLKQILQTFKFLDEDKTYCTKDADCGLNVCSCKAMRDEFIKPEDRACMIVCPGKKVQCINNACVLR